MEELINKIESSLQEKLGKLREELSEKEKLNLSVQSQNIEAFVKKYQNNEEIDINLLTSFYDLLNKDKLETAGLEHYKALYTYYNFLKTSSSSLKQDIEVIKKELDNLMYEIELAHRQIFKKIQTNGFEKKILSENIERLEQVLKIVKKVREKQILSIEEFELISNYLLTEDILLDSALIATFIGELTKQNTIIMKNNVELAIQQAKELQAKQEQERKEREAKEREEQKQRAAEVAKTNEGQIDLEEKLRRILSEKYYNAYKRAKEIVLEYPNVSPANEKIASELRTKTISYRQNSYASLETTEEQKALIAADIIKNILPEIESQANKEDKVESKNFEKLIAIIAIYDEIVKKEKQTEKFNYITFLTTHERFAELALCNNADALFEAVTLFSSSNVRFNYLMQYADELKRAKETYVEALETTPDDFNLIKECYEELQEKCNQLKEEYEKIYEKIKPVDNSEVQTYLEIAKHFYEGITPINNIIAFGTDNDSFESIAEQDIDEDRRITNKQQAYDMTINAFSTMVSSTFVAEQGQSKDHQDKSDQYGEEFLREFKVKCYQKSHYRIFYSRFNTTLAQVFPEYIPNSHIIFIYHVSFGDIGGAQKNGINEEALRRCYDQRDKLRYIISLMQTDWSQLTPEETKAKKEEIKNYLIRHNIKLGHFIAKGASLVPSPNGRGVK